MLISQPENYPSFPHARPRLAPLPPPVALAERAFASLWHADLGPPFRETHNAGSEQSSHELLLSLSFPCLFIVFCVVCASFALRWFFVVGGCGGLVFFSCCVPSLLVF